MGRKCILLGKLTLIFLIFNLLSLSYSVLAASTPSSTFKCSASIRERQLVFVESIPIGQRIKIVINCTSKIVDAKAYYGLTLVPSKLEINDNKAVLVLTNVPLEGSVTIYVKGLTSSTSIKVNVTYRAINYTKPTINREEEARRLSSIMRTIKEIYSQGITAILFNTTSPERSTLIGHTDTLKMRATGRLSYRIKGKCSIYDAIYFALVLAALLYLLIRYRPSLRHGGQAGEGEGLQ
jgi:hypothetical protein